MKKIEDRAFLDIREEDPIWNYPENEKAVDTFTEDKI
jgi:hypothetical protein